MNALGLSICSLIVLASPAGLVRVAVVDDSPSMRGSRIAAVRAELTAVIRQLPPSDEYPLALIVFHSIVEPTQVFTDQQTAEQAVSKLKADGKGTAIAPALVRAHDYLQTYGAAAPVLVMLFTDGEDSEQRAIDAAEGKLDALFGERTQQGLSQTVFVKRWGNANSKLVARLQEQGNAQVLDAGELKLEPVTLIPAVQLLAARRSPDDLQRLQVAVVPTVKLQGSPPKGTLSDFQFTCRNPGATPNAPLRAMPGTAGSRFVVSLPIPKSAEASGHLDLVFQVAPTTAPVPQGSFILPILPSSTVVVRVTLPTLGAKNSLTATIRAAEVLQWEDPLRLRVRCRATVAITATAADKSITVDRRMTAEVIPLAGSRVVGSNPTLSIPKPGTYAQDIILDVPVIDAKTRPLRTPDLELEIRFRAQEKNVTCEPASLRVKHAGLNVPSQVTTIITPEVRRIGRPVWIDLVEPLAAFDADVSFRVAGPIPKDTTLTLMVPGNVRGNVLPPGARLPTGETVLTLRVLARLSAGKPERLDFSIVAPPPTPAVDFRVERGFSLPVVGPPPGRLVHRQDAAAQAALQVSALDNQDLIDVAIHPDLFGISREPLRRITGVTARPLSATGSAPGCTGPLFGILKLPLRIPPATGQSFFFDSRQTIEVDLVPDKPTAAVLPGRVQVIVQRQAPFKRLLVYLAWALLPAGIVMLAAHAIRRFREPIFTLRDEPWTLPSAKS